MPRYDYRCEAESHRFELKQSFDAEPVAECPECGSIARRVFHVPAVVFKGSGFYVNDYGRRGSSSTLSSNGANSADSDSSASSSSSESSSDKTDSDSKAKSENTAKASSDS